MILSAVDDAFKSDMLKSTANNENTITFAGYGEPLLRLDTLIESATMIKNKRVGINLRVKTNGLIASKDSDRIANQLKNGGIDSVSISILSDNHTQYMSIMQVNK